MTVHKLQADERVGITNARACVRSCNTDKPAEIIWNRVDAIYIFNDHSCRARLAEGNCVEKKSV